MSYQIVLNFDDEDNNPRYSIRSEASESAPEDNIQVLINPALEEQNEITLDNHGFPTSESLEAWHRKHNPHLFTN